MDDADGGRGGISDVGFELTRFRVRILDVTVKKISILSD